MQIGIVVFIGVWMAVAGIAAYIRMSRDFKDNTRVDERRKGGNEK